MRKSAFGYLVGSWLMALLCLSSALGQTVTGSITGQVKDPSGAVVVGASVTAQNAATSVSEWNSQPATEPGLAKARIGFARVLGV